MPKPQVKQSKPKKSHKLAWILASPFIAIVSIWALFSFILNPIWDHFDKQKFTTLDTEMRALFEEIKAVDKEAEWKYEKKCDINLVGGGFSDGTFTCDALIYLSKTTTQVNELSDLHEIYYPIIDNNVSIKTSSNLLIYNSDYFGKNFVVNGAEKNYIEVKNGLECNYLAKLDQTDDIKGYKPRLYGSRIEGNEGKLTLSLECSGISARQSWYPKLN